MFSLLWLACAGDESQYADVTSRDEVDVIVEPSDDTSDEVNEPGDTVDEVIVEEKISFRAPLMTCEEVQKRTLTMTRMFPGSLDTEDISEASFYNEVSRIPLGASGIEFSQTEDLDDCIFSVDLPTPNLEELQEVKLLEDGEQVEIGVQWAFYYPTTFVQQSVDCQTLSLTETNTQKVSCESTYSTPLTPTPDPSQEVSDAAVVSGDIYDWGSDVLPVYVQGDVQGAFGDLGFELGWNLARFIDGEIVLVEPLGYLDQLEQIVLDNRDFLPRYQINGRGSISAEADFGDSYSIDLISSQWFNGVTTVETGVSMYIQDSDVSWSFEIWGAPESDQFFGLSFPSDSPFYQQWASEVDVAAFVPIVFSGMPSQYSNGAPVQGDDIQSTDARLGAVCKDSSTLAFTFLRESRRPSDVHWYSLMGISPGWYAQYGTHGDASTWRMVIENTDSANPYNYVSLSIGNSCQVPSDWL